MLIDLVFVLLMVMACFKGLRKGFIVALFSIVAFLIGLAAALKLSAVVANKLSGSLSIHEKWLPVLSFVFVFLVVVLLVNLGGRFIQKTVEFAMLGWLNRLLGMVLFMALYTIIFSIFLFYLVQLHILKPAEMISSQTYEVLKPIGPYAIDLLGKIFPIFKDLFGQLEQFFGEVSNKLPH